MIFQQTKKPHIRSSFISQKKICQRANPFKITMSRNVCTHRRISMELSLIYFNDLMTATAAATGMKGARTST